MAAAVAAVAVAPNTAARKAEVNPFGGLVMGIAYLAAGGTCSAASWLRVWQQCQNFSCVLPYIEFECVCGLSCEF